MMLSLPIFAVLLGVAAPPAPQPSQVLVIANTTSPESREIAAYYMAKRRIPPENLCRIRTTAEEEIFRHVYDSSIASAAGAYLKRHGLVERIHYIVTTRGVPLKIRGSQGANGDCASVDSELAMLYQTLRGRPHATSGAINNPFFGQRDAPFSHPRFPMYMVTRLAAYSVAEVKSLIDRSLAAKNTGKVVLDLSSAENNDGNSWLRTAALLLPENRYLLEESEQVVTGVKDVIGYASWGSNDRNRKQRFLGMQWLPGAVATEFVSTNGRTLQQPPETWTFGRWSAPGGSGWFAGSPQSLSADLIYEGATAASGHVYEPFLQGTPRPNHLFPAYLSGRTLGESYYLAIPALSWQNIVLGDPLCVLR
jgi:uncharacterized protein (TIGR03790 family)